MAKLNESTAKALKDISNVRGGDSNASKNLVIKLITEMKRFQQRAKKHIEEKYVDFIPNLTTADMYLDGATTMIHKADHLLQTVKTDVKDSLHDARQNLIQYTEELKEVTLGLNLTNRILKIDDLFQRIEEENALKNYLVVLDLLSKLKSLIFGQETNDTDRILRSCKCYEPIKVKYHIQAQILKQNLHQQFERLVQTNAKQYPHSKCVTLQISTDINQLHDTTMALFQTQYNPTRLCEFLLENCLEPIITKPVSLEYNNSKPGHIQLQISYSLKDIDADLRPGYTQVLEHIKTLLNMFENINVIVYGERYVYTILGDHIKTRFLQLLIEECLMQTIPETIEEFQESTVVADVREFEQYLADIFLINLDIEADRVLSVFAYEFETYFHNRFFKKIHDSAKEIMQKDLQDMTIIAEKNTPQELENKPLLYPRSAVSKSTLDLIKLLERILRQKGNDDEQDSYLNVITVILDAYIYQMPKIHEKLLESIPQQAILFYNNCMFLAHWLTENASRGMTVFPNLVNSLQNIGNKYLKTQTEYQQTIIMGILKEIDMSDSHSLGSVPMKLTRQCLRQMDLLKNVWLDVLPANVYTNVFSKMLHNFCNELIRRILTLEDISVTVAQELSDIITVVIEKGPTLFKEKHDILQVKCWLKFEQLKLILNASLQELIEQWCDGAGPLTASYKADEIIHLIRALFQNTAHRANAISRIV